ncbi:TetR/AcrR family transcriptional regulator, partial [Bacillus sp. HC-Mk]
MTTKSPTSGKVDLRIRRTHKLLWDSLFELMTQSKQKYSTITINQICDRAMVHRTTFYKHFEDKDALLTFGFKRYGKMIAEIPVSDRLSKPFQVMEQFLHHEELGKILETQMSDERKAIINRNAIKLYSSMPSSPSFVSRMDAPQKN